MDNATLILAGLAALIFLGMGLEEVFRRTGIPDVLVLLGLGLAASTTGIIEVERLSGVDRVFTTCALVLILFEGSVRLKLGDLKSALGGSLMLTVVSFVVTVAVVGALATFVFGMRPLAGALLGTILGGTSSAVVIPMVQTLRISKDTRTILMLESALSDVLCIVFALALLGALTAGDVSWGMVAQDMAIGFGGALLIGSVAGIGWAFGLRTLRRKRASMLFVAAAVFLVYALAESLSTFGAIACLAFGIVLGNAELLAKILRRSYAMELGLYEGERFFLSEMAFILKVFFFVYLGASLRLNGFEPLVFGGLVTVAIFLIRPFSVRLSMRAGNTPRQDAVISSMLVPKGLAAAVLAALPVQAEIAEARTIEAITFGVILFSITLASLLTLFEKRAFIAGAYRRFFAAYPAEDGQVDAATSAVPAAAPSPPAAEIPQVQLMPAPEVEPEAAASAPLTKSAG